EPNEEDGLSRSRHFRTGDRTQAQQIGQRDAQNGAYPRLNKSAASQSLAIALFVLAQKKHADSSHDSRRTNYSLSTSFRCNGNESLSLRFCRPSLSEVQLVTFIVTLASWSEAFLTRIMTSSLAGTSASKVACSFFFSVAKTVEDSFEENNAAS